MRSGMIIVNKEAGYTSSDVVAKLRGILRMKKIGHTGTLDPAAEGVLPVCIGYATRLCDMIAAASKEYEAVLRLGILTDTQDMTGTVLQELGEEECLQRLEERARRQTMEEVPNCPNILHQYILSTMQQFVGTIWQVPPKYSAIWINGKRAYQLARKGMDFEIPRRQVQIYSLQVCRIALPYITFRVVCSPGTYIRTLCEDIGNTLGVGGVMEHLVRTRVGDFTLEKALTLGQIEEMARKDPAQLEEKYLYPTDYFFRDKPAVVVRSTAMPFLRNGNPLSSDNLEEGIRQQKQAEDLIRVYGDDHEFYGIYRYDNVRHRLICVKMFHQVDAVVHAKGHRQE